MHNQPSTQKVKSAPPKGADSRSIHHNRSTNSKFRGEPSAHERTGTAAPHQFNDSISSSSKEEKDIRAITAGKTHRLKVYQHELTVSSLVPPKRKKKMPKREVGDIKTFSKAARRRVMRLMNRILTSVLSTALFVSCTYRHGEMEIEEFQYRFFKLFLPKLKEIVPEICLMWRLEPHVSGYPHFHIIAWSYRKNLKIGSEYYQRQIRKAWRNAIDQHDKSAQLYSCRIEECDSYEKVKRYVSKYVAKEEKQPENDIEGRRWGRSKNLPCSSITEATLSKDEFEALKQAIETILYAKKVPKGLREAILRSDNNLFCWLDEDEIWITLEVAGLDPPAKDYKHYLKTGSVDLTDDELYDLYPEYM